MTLRQERKLCCARWSVSSMNKCEAHSFLTRSLLRSIDTDHGYCAVQLPSCRNRQIHQPWMSDSTQKCCVCGNFVRWNQTHRGFWPKRRHHERGGCFKEKLYWLPPSENFAAPIPPLTVTPVLHFTEVLQPRSLVRICATVAPLPVDDAAAEHCAAVAVDFSPAVRVGFDLGRISQWGRNSDLLLLSAVCCSPFCQPSIRDPPL
jgi:hypothetical protein